MIGKQAFYPAERGHVNLVMIICNHCPYVLFRMPQISQLVKDYKDRVKIFAINSNDASPTTEDSHPEDAPELMPDFIERWDLQCPYIFDDSQEIARAYGAVCTPEFYVVDADGIIVYHGELDPSHTSNDLMPTGSSLRHALDLTLVNKPITWEPTPSFGCSVKWVEQALRPRKSHRFRSWTYDASKRWHQPSDWIGYDDVEEWKQRATIRMSAISSHGQNEAVDLLNSVQHVKTANLAGDFVECGVYMGGSSAEMIYAAGLLNLEKNMWMYDTYNGVPEPSEEDTIELSAGHVTSTLEWWRENKQDKNGESAWCYSSLEDVKTNIQEFTAGCGYRGSVHYVKGLVQDTIPKEAPEKISILRVDVDLVEPTMHVLKHLYPRVVSGGHVILDDYGKFPSIKSEIDKFFATQGNPYIYRVNYNCRHIIKP